MNIAAMNAALQTQARIIILCTHKCRAVDKIFVFGVLIWLPKAALLGAQCLA